jgi:alkanesulfonate monooxygenase SsuD/methylene tetrahydromethanopterin reductase-like flavin-dependent oxidoreductase (luciferase family)
MAAVQARCEEVDRDPKDLETSFLAFVIIDEDGDKAKELQREFVLKQGLDLTNLSEEDAAKATDRHFCGTPDDVAEQVQKRVLDQGIDGVIINLITNGHQPGAVELAGKALKPLV